MLKTDVLVIGVGAGGIRAAQAARQNGADVLLVGPLPRIGSGSTFSGLSGGWGIQALLPDEDTPENRRRFRNDILSAGLGQCRKSLVDILVAESGAAVENLMVHGLRLKQDPQGIYQRATGCFSSVPRALLTESMDNIIETFQGMVNTYTPDVLPGQVLDLLVTGGECHGARVFLERHGETVVVAGATVLATGGAAAIYEHHLVDEHQVGSGCALAARAGARVRNMEFVQFMLGVTDGHTHRFLPMDSLTDPDAFTAGQDAIWLETAIPETDLRERAVQLRQTHHPFSCRDASGQIDRAFHHALRAGRSVHYSGRDKRLAGYRVVHCAHAFNGGIWIDDQAATTVPGLYAVGETAAGPHGADRVGGCMLTATQVFGRRAGQFAAKRALKYKQRPRPENLTGQSDSEPARDSYSVELENTVCDIQRQVKLAMQAHVSIERSRTDMAGCLALLQEANNRLEQIGCQAGTQPCWWTA
ncbi:MAG: FAD-binding protein, partial [Desulfobacterales bacterium]|nr:FAD-binding protein [Desulfobacterales bacterium]